ncbi:amidohydrolase family protein [Streptomyces sp. SID3343]|nr:amidohydrolase family protein [Streptomyces sp. SID3343]
MMIDAHHHLWDPTTADYPWMDGPEMAPIRRRFDVEDLRPLLRAAGVDRTIVVEAHASDAETAAMLALTTQPSTPIAGVVGWTDLTAPGRLEAVARLRELPGGRALVGFRHQVQSEPDPDWLRRGDVLRGLAALADADLAYDLVVQPHQLPGATHAAREVPGLTFVLDHLGKPDIAAGAAVWRGQVAALAALPNTYCKLSGLVTEADWKTWTPEELRPYVETALDLFGPERCMYGSDWPVCLLAADYARVHATLRACLPTLTAAEDAAIMGGTAARAYRFEDTACAA